MTIISTEFIRDFKLVDTNIDVIHHAKRCLLDTIGVAAAGTRMPVSRISRDVAATIFGQDLHGSRILFDSGRSTPSGAAFVNGTTIDSFDAHDGHPLTKGHAGCGVLAGLFAFADNGPDITGSDALAALIIGYEVAIRSGISLHQTVSDYHTSGAWVGLGVAAIGSRLLNLSLSETREALGIAEYNGPRSQMMRCIDHPSMVKDGSGWGAMVGVASTYLAQAGFTGAPAITVEAPEVRENWMDLGFCWRIAGQYIKEYPVCRWAQPAMEAIREIKRCHSLSVADIAAITVRTFYEATRLTVCNPQSTEAAQYSLPWPIAALLLRDKVGPAEISESCLGDVEMLRLAERVHLLNDPEYSRLFPAERWAKVEITLNNGQVLHSGPAIAKGGANNPLSDAEIVQKFQLLMESSGFGSRVEQVEKIVWNLENELSFLRLIDAVTFP